MASDQQQANKSLNWTIIGVIVGSLALLFTIFKELNQAFILGDSRHFYWVLMLEIVFCFSGALWASVLFFSDNHKQQALSWLANQQLSEKYKKLLNNILGVFDRLFSKGIDQQKHPLHYFWSVSLLGLVLLFAIIYPFISLFLQWLVTGDAVYLGDVRVLKERSNSYYWVVVVLGFLLVCYFFLNKTSMRYYYWWFYVAVFVYLIGVVFSAYSGNANVLWLSMFGGLSVFLLWLVVARLKEILNIQIFTHNFLVLIVFFIISPVFFIFSAALSGGIIGVVAAFTGASFSFLALVGASAREIVSSLYGSKGVVGKTPVGMVIAVAFVSAVIGALIGNVLSLGGKESVDVIANSFAGVIFGFTIGLVFGNAFVYKNIYVNRLLIYCFGMIGVLYFLVGFLYFEENIGGSLVVFFGFLPLVNAIFDFLSIGLTRYLLNKSIHSKRGALFLWSFADVIGAIALFFLLKLSLITLFILLTDKTGAVLFPLLGEQGLLTQIKANPSDYVWLYFTLFSTLIPTLIHLNIGFFSIAASTFHPLPKVFSGIATQLGKVNGNPLLSLLAFAGLVILTTFFIVLPLFALSQFWQLFLQHHDSLLAWLVDVAIAYATWVSSW